jgi:hypothetical protein
MPINRSILIAEDSLFCRNNFRRLLKVVCGMMIIAYLLIGFIVYQHFSRPIPQYFVTTSNGLLFEIHAE